MKFFAVTIDKSTYEFDEEEITELTDFTDSALDQIKLMGITECKSFISFFDNAEIVVQRTH